MFYESEYADRTFRARQNAQKNADLQGITVDEIKISIDNPALTWKTLFDTILKRKDFSLEVIVDITTMPREVIWIVIDLLLLGKEALKYVYNRPTSYNKDWLSRDPAKPRLVYKLETWSKSDFY